MKRSIPVNNSADFLLYTTSEGDIRIEVVLKDENVWLSQRAMAELFGVNRSAITKHLLNIFNTNELEEDSVSSILEHTAKDGKIYKTKFYNLDAIIGVGYRVNSYQATQFRIWATKVLKEFMIKVSGPDRKNLCEDHQGEKEKEVQEAAVHMKVIELNPIVGNFAENKDRAQKIRTEEILPTIQNGEKVILDFNEVGSATQSFIHALISDLLRRYGDEVLDLVYFKNCNDEVQKIISIVVEYMQESE